MLEKIRDLSHNYVFKIFFILIAIIFALSVVDLNNNNQFVIHVGKEKISLQDFWQTKQQILAELGNKASQHTTAEINKSIIDRIVTQSLIEQEAKELGINIDSETVAFFIRNDKSLHKNDQFDLNNYKKLLEASNLTEDKLISKLSSQIASQLLISSVLANLPLEETYNNHLYEYINEKRSIALVSVNANKVELGAASSKEIEEYYNKNKDSFLTPEYRSFVYVLLSKNHFIQNYAFTDAEMEQEYKNNKEEYSIAETKDFYHFLAPSKELADEIKLELEKGTDPALLSKKFADQKVVGELFINQSSSGFLSNISSNLFQLKYNQVSDVNKSDLGWHIFKVTKINEKQYKSFAESKVELENSLKSKLLEKQLYELSQHIEDDIASGAQLPDIAQKHKLPLVEVKNIALDGSYADTKGSKIDPQIVKLAFDTPVNEESNLTSLDNNLVITKVTSSLAPALKPLKTVDKEISKIITINNKDNLSLEIAKILHSEFVKQPQLITDKLDYKLAQNMLEPIYKKYNLPIKNKLVIDVTNQDISRSMLNDSNNLPFSFVDHIFNLEPNKSSVVDKIDEMKYGFAIVKKISNGSNSKTPLYDYIKGANNYKNALYQQYLDYLRIKYQVKFNSDFIANINNDR
jgi:peptidyl-prolyl cis-trans isomerase D